jgi:ABC-2 type transport system permease protein
MTSASSSLTPAQAPEVGVGSPQAEILQETLALTTRLFLQLARRPSTLVAGVLQPLIWLVLFGALFANAPAGLLPGGGSYGRFLGAGVIVFTAFSAALNAGLPLMFDREFGAAPSCMPRCSTSPVSAWCRAWPLC